VPVPKPGVRAFYVHMSPHFDLSVRGCRNPQSTDPVPVPKPGVRLSYVNVSLYFDLSVLDAETLRAQIQCLCLTQGCVHLCAHVPPL